VIAFNDINPVAPVHVLIVPKVHIESVKDIDSQNADVLIDIHLAANKVADKLVFRKKATGLLITVGLMRADSYAYSLPFNRRNKFGPKNSCKFALKSARINESKFFVDFVLKTNI
jgi:hypothetical protein